MRTLPITLLLLLLPLPAAAQGFGVRVTPAGLDALTEVALSRVPAEVVIPSMDRELYDCPGSRVISAQIPDTPIRLGWGDLDIYTEDGRIFVGTIIDVDVAARVEIDNPYACFGAATCDLSASLRSLGVVVELAAGTSPEGGIEFFGAAVDIQLTPEDLDLQSESCAIGEVATWLFNAFEGWALDLLIPRLESTMGDQIGVALTEVFSDTVGMKVERGNLTIEAWLDVLDLSATEGVTAGGDTRITWTGPAMFGGDLPQVADPEGEALPADFTGQFQVAVSDRLVTEALYEAWRGGLISQMLADRRQSIVLGGEGAVQQIGLPAGTEIEISLDIEEPLSATFGRVASNVANLSIRGLLIQVSVRPPGGEASMIDVRVDGSLAASVAVDAELGGLVLDIQNLEIEQIKIDGEESELTVDGARLRGFVSGTIMPMISERLSGLPIAPAVQEVEGTYVYVREISSEGGWQRVGFDLFTPDPTDNRAPDTSLEDPALLLSAGTASFTVSGSDDTTPDSLLRYRAWLDGEALTDGPTSIRALYFDVADGDHVLEVAAVDTNGNVDPAPVIHAFVVDGIPPRLSVSESPGAIVLDASVNAAWEASDEGGRGVTTGWTLRRVNGDATTTVIREAPFGTDTTLAISTDSLVVGELYELEIVARDEAGNFTSARFGFALHPSLATGCSASGAAPGSPIPTFALFFVIGCILWSRRR